jgi:rhodanese-related sulfurtransferase
VIVADPGRHEEAMVRLGRIGFDNVAGYLGGGMEAIEVRPDLLRTTERVSAASMADALAGPEPPCVLDVRTRAEWCGRHIAGSINVPLNELQARLGDLAEHHRIVLHCAGGYRSSIAASLLQRAGIDRLAELAGGLAAWDAAKLPVQESGAAPATA